MGTPEPPRAKLPKESPIATNKTSFFFIMSARPSTGAPRKLNLLIGQHNVDQISNSNLGLHRENTRILP
jgi:hypothetical protein